MALNLGSLTGWLRSKLEDEEGLFRKGKFAPKEAVKKVTPAISNAYKAYQRATPYIPFSPNLAPPKKVKVAKAKLIDPASVAMGGAAQRYINLARTNPAAIMTPGGLAYEGLAGAYKGLTAEKPQFFMDVVQKNFPKSKLASAAGLAGEFIAPSVIPLGEIKAGSKLLPRVAKTAAKSAAVGGVYGGATKLAESKNKKEYLSNLRKGATQGALYGGLLGGALGVVPRAGNVKGFGTLYRDDIETTKNAIKFLREMENVGRGKFAGKLDLDTLGKLEKDAEAMRVGYRMMSKTDWEKMPLLDRFKMIAQKQKDLYSDNPLIVGIKGKEQGNVAKAPLDDILKGKKVEISTPIGRKMATSGSVLLEELKTKDFGLDIARKALKENPDLKLTKKPIIVGVDINTGEKQLLDGYHRYIKNKGVGEFKANFLPMEKGDIVKWDRLNMPLGKLTTQQPPIKDIQPKGTEAPKVKIKPAIPKELEPLAEEARKYKTAEEFQLAIIDKLNAVSKTRLSSKGATRITYIDPYKAEVKAETEKMLKEISKRGMNITDFYNQAKGIKPEAPKIKIKAPTLKISEEGVTTPPLSPIGKVGGGGEGGFKPPQAPPTTPPVSDQDLISRLTQAIKKTTPLRGKQEELYTKARGEKLARLLKAREKMAGEKGFYEELGALKGELPKVEYEAIRQEFNQESVDRLFNMIKRNKTLDAWDKVNAQVGLQKLLGEKGLGVPTKGEIQKLHAVFGKEFTETLLSKRPLFEKMGDLGMQLYNLPRSMMTGVGDFSATLMQNIMFAYRHPITTTKNFVESVKMFGNEEFYKTSMEEIAQRPTYELMKQGKVALTEVSPVMTAREEQFMSSLAEKIPGFGKVVRATGRAWTGFLNKMRADVFDQLVATKKALGEDINNPKFLKDAGEFVNAGTGRGSLGKLERVAPVLAQGMFSARKLAATLKFLDPRLYITADPVVRKEALRTVTAFVGGGMLITQLAKMAGAEVGDDPTSADFGKIKIGNTRFNVFGTYQQVAVLLARLYKGYATSSTTGRKMMLGDENNPYAPTRLDLLTRFFESKEHPTLSLIFGAMRGQNQIGEPFNLPVEVLNRFTAMIFTDSYDLYKEHGAVGLLGVIPAILGIPTQTYGSYYPKREVTPSGRATIKLKPETGLTEDLLLKLTGQPKSNIPENQQEQITQKLWGEKMAKADKYNLKLDLEAGKIPRTEPSDIESKELIFKYSNEDKKQLAKGVWAYKENGTVKTIDLREPIKEPTLTGNSEVDKKLISSYKSKIYARAKQIVALFELGLINQAEMEERINKLYNKQTSYLGKSGYGKKPKKVSVKVKAPKKRVVKISDVKKPELPTIKITPPPEILAERPKRKTYNFASITEDLPEKVRLTKKKRLGIVKPSTIRII
jgi:hypothetical protein